eukprot:scaffold2813_cov121-Isochrysis_galbana.AAC.1
MWMWMLCGITGVRTARGKYKYKYSTHTNTTRCSHQRERARSARCKVVPRVATQLSQPKMLKGKGPCRMPDDSDI